jgi:regulator of replication initiation timing
MLKKILSFFSPGKQEDEVINIHELEATAKKLFEQHLKDSMMPNLERIRQEIDETIAEVEKKCTLLEDAKLKNENIPLKEKQFMTGNRESYVKHVRILIRNAKIPSTIAEAEEAVESFFHVIDPFANHTMKARQILNHFFEHETESIHKSITSLKKLYDSIKELLESEQHKFHIHLEKAISEFNACTLGISSFSKEVKQIENSIKSAKKEVMDLKRDLKEKIDSKENIFLRDLQLKEEELKQRLSSIKADTNARFSKFQRAMKKYERIALDDTELVRQYLGDSFLAIANDAQNRGELILRNVKDKVANNSIEIKNSEKIIAELDSLIESKFIQSANKAIAELKSHLSKAKATIASMEIAQEIESLKHKVFLTNNRVNELTSQLSDKKEKLESLSEEKHIAEIEQLLAKVMGKPVKLKANS